MRRDSRKLCVSSAAALVLLLTCLIPVSASQSSPLIASYGVISYKEPLVGGWGGVRLFEVNRFTEANPPVRQRTTPASDVFIGEVASNAEMVMRLLKQRGYNAIRAYFESEHTVSNLGDPEWAWNDAWFEKFVELAKYYDLWVIVDYHGYCEAYQFTDDWISFWQDKISRYKDIYDKMVWEPINEPRLQWQDGSHKLEGRAAVDALTDVYQRWIGMCRSLGDTHWIVVSAVQFWTSLPHVDWYPNVNDPLNKTFLNWHFYYFYDDEPDDWTVPEAEANADYWFQVVKDAIAKYYRPYLCTELGAASYYGTPPPDLVVDGSAGYSNTSLAFVKRLIQNFDSYPGRIGYMLWMAGDWTPRSQLYGAMDVWGDLLNHQAFL